SGAPGWSLKSSVVNGVDSLDFPFDLTGDQDITNAVATLTDKSTELSGAIRDAGGRPGVDFTIVVYAQDTRFWTPQSRRVSITRPSTDGNFVFRSLPPGDYMLSAVTDVEPGAQFDPQFLRQLVSSSTRVSLAEGEKR